jgi:hypothetical protein
MSTVGSGLYATHAYAHKLSFMKVQLINFYVPVAAECPLLCYSNCLGAASSAALLCFVCSAGDTRITWGGGILVNVHVRCSCVSAGSQVPVSV